MIPRDNPVCAELVRDVLAKPRDDGPRLIIADWLDEHSSEVQADLIRTQILIVNHCNHKEHIPKGVSVGILRMKERDLLNELTPGYVKVGMVPILKSHLHLPHNSDATDTYEPSELLVRVERGFPSVAVCDQVQFFRRAAYLGRYFPIVEWRLCDAQPQSTIFVRRKSLTFHVWRHCGVSGEAVAAEIIHAVAGREFADDMFDSVTPFDWWFGHPEDLHPSLWERLEGWAFREWPYVAYRRREDALKYLRKALKQYANAARDSGRPSPDPVLGGKL